MELLEIQCTWLGFKEYWQATHETRNEYLQSTAQAKEYHGANATHDNIPKGILHNLARAAAVDCEAFYQLSATNVELTQQLMAQATEIQALQKQIANITCHFMCMAENNSR